MIVVAGPQKDLLPEATDAIRAFVKDGGKALVMVEPEFKDAYPNLDQLAKGWNVELGKDVIVDVSGMGQLFGAGELTPIASEYPYHDITRNFRLMTIFHMARSASAGKGTPPEGVSAQDLVQTSARSWAETDVKVGSELAFDEKKDKKGPVTIGAAVTLRKATPAAHAVALRLAGRGGAAEAAGRKGRRVRRLRLGQQLAPRRPGQQGLLPERGGLALRGPGHDLHPAPGAGGPAPLPDARPAVVRGSSRPRGPPRPLRRDRGLDLVAASAVEP